MPLPSAAVLLLIYLLLAATGCSPADDNTSASTSAQEAPSSGETIASGSFVDKGGQKTIGSFVIERDGSDLRLVLTDEFRTDEGPDLHVVLTPTMVAEAGNENTMAGEAHVVGRLAKQAGEQVYDLPDDLNLERYSAVAIHCIKFSHLYGAAPLR